VRATPEHLPNLLVLGGAHFGLGENEQAITYLRQFLARVPDHEPSRRMLAAALLQKGNSDEAREVLAPLESKAADDAQLLAMIGSVALKTGDLESSKRYFERLTEMQPDNPAAWAQLGTVRVAMGDVGEGTLDLERSVEQDPTARSLTALALAHIRARDFDKALEVAERLSDQFPESATGAILVGIAYAGKNDPEQSRAAFERALEIDPAAIDASTNLAGLRARADDFEGAHEILAKALAQAPENLRLLGRMAEVEARLGRFDDAKERLREMGRIDPKAIGPKIALARLLVGVGEPQKALDAAAAQLPLYPENTALLDVVGQAYLAAGQPYKAVEIFERLLEKTPSNGVTLTRLAKAYETAGRPDLFKDYLETAIKLEPDNALAKIVLARMAFAEGDLPRAEALVADLDKLSADEPRVAELLGDIALKRNDVAAAATAYKNAFSKEPNSQRVIKLALAQKSTGDPGYRQMLDTWLVQHPDDSLPRLFVANDDIQAGRYQAARENYAKVVELVPDNVLARNNLAWLLWHEGDAQAALPHAERALELAPDAATVQDTAGLVYLKLGNISRALTLLKEAAGGLPDNAEVQYHYAQALAAEGNSKEARDVLMRALSSGADFSERAEAEALLKELGI
jgi:putative PEP-CTERM system TPR-repeat lipoprotein